MVAILAVLLSALAAAPPAVAHGPVAPVATSYLARVARAPAGVTAKIIDGYVRMWLQVRPTDTVVVLDYRGAPYLRFSPTGVEVNSNSQMFYLNQVPVAALPPAGLTPTTPPHWHVAAGGHAYEWHDGRLQALAGVALRPGQRYVGRWSIPLRVNGRTAAITGGLWHRDRPSPVWFWPIVVVLLCVLAAWRLHDAALDARLAKGLGFAALAGLTIAGIGQSLHGRPSIPVLHLAELAVLLGFAAWGIRHILLEEPGWFAYFAIAAVAVWEGVNLIPALLNGFVLISLPGTVARLTAVVCLASGISLLPLLFRLADRRHKEEDSGEHSVDQILEPSDLPQAHP